MKKITKLSGILLLFFISNLSIAANLYWIGGTGTWRQTAHWSASSGGSTIGRLPTATDNVIFDSHSFTNVDQTVTIDSISTCDSINWKAITQSNIQLSGSSTLYIYGSLTMNSSMILSNFSGNIYFQSNQTGNKITSAGTTFAAGYIYFNGTGDWTLQDALTTTGYIYLNSGTLYSNNKNITCDYFNSNNSNNRGLVLGSSIFTITGDGNGWNTTPSGNNGGTLSFSAGTSTIKFSYIGYYSSLSAGPNDVFNNILFLDNSTSTSSVNGGSGYQNITFTGSGSVSGNNNTTYNNITFGGSGSGISYGIAYNNITFSSSGSINAATGAHFKNVSFAGAGTITGNNGTFNKVTFNSTGVLDNAATYDSLIFAAGNTYTLQYGYTQTIGSYFKATGTCNSPIVLHSSSTGSAATISQSSGNDTLNYIQMQDINGTGGATFTASTSSNLGDNSGWAFPAAPTDLYWIGGSGNWNSPNNWSTTSGGAPACIIPTPSINVHFDANSFTNSAQVVNVNITNAYCDSMDWSGVNQTDIQISGSSSVNIHIYGSLKMNSTMILSNYTGNLWFESTKSGNSVTSAGLTFAAGYLYFNGGGSWTLKDALTTTGYLYLNAGTLTTNNNNITCDYFNSSNSNARGLSLGSSIFTVTGDGNGWNTTPSGSNGGTLSFSAGTSTIKFSYIGYYSSLSAGPNDIFNLISFLDNSTSTSSVNGGLKYNNITFAGAGSISGNNNTTYNNITFAGNGSINGGIAYQNVIFGGTTSISGNSGGGTTFNKVVCNNSGSFTYNCTYDSLLFKPGYSYTFGYSYTQTISKYFNANGNCNAPITFHSSNTGNQASISVATGTLTVSYIQMQDINATGGATFIANTSSNIGDNPGWLFNSPTDLYWIGNTGNWSSPANWSTTSGGPTACVIPGPTTNVHFDANSFNAAAQTVTIDVIAYCDSMNWSAVTQNSIQLGGSSALHINGSFVLHPKMIITNYSGNVYFESAKTGNRIVTKGKIFSSSYIYFNNSGSWTLMDALNTGGYLYLNYGSLNTNNNNITCNYFNSNNSNTRSLVLGSSVVTITGDGNGWSTNGGSGGTFSFDAGTSLIKFSYIGYYSSLSGGPNDAFYNVSFLDNSNSTCSINGGSGYNNVTFAGAGNINANNNTSFNNVSFQNTTYTGAINSGISYNNVTFAGPGTISGHSGSNFNDVTFAGAGTITGNTSTFSSVTFNANGTLDNTATYDTLIFASGNTYTLQNGYTQYLSYLNANGTCTTPIIIQSSSAGSQATISDAGNVTVSFVQLKDIQATGGATFTANNTKNNGDNSGWAINAATPVIAAFTSSQNQLTTTFSNASSGATSYKWIFGDGNTSTQTNPVYTYSLAGNYIVYLIAYNSCGANDTINHQVNPGCHAPVAGFTPTVTGLDASFKNTSTNASTILWTFGDDSTSSAFSPKHTYFKSGKDTVCLKLTSGCGNSSMCKTLTITCAAPKATYNYSVKGLTVNFTNTSSNAANISWSFGDGQTSTSSNPSHIYSNTGTYSVKLTGVNGCGRDSLIQSVAVTCVPPTPTFVTNPQGLNVDFVSTSANTTSVSWNFGDPNSHGNNTSILSQLSHNFTTTGTYTVCLTAMNGCATGGTKDSCRAISVCAPPVANFTALASVLTVTLTNTSTNGTNYYWNLADSTASNITSPVHKYAHSGTYNVCLTASNNCGSNTICSPVKTVCTPLTEQPICMVTVDTLSKHNIITWQHPVTTGVKSFVIYREISANNYQPIGSVTYTSSSSSFTDTVQTKYAPNKGSPNTGSNRYEIAVLDTCGNYTQLSPYHNTIFLQNNNGTFSWNAYTIQNSANPVNNYLLFRRNDSTSAWHQVASVPGTQTTVTDTGYANYTNGGWYIETQWGTSCSPGGTLGTLTTSRSNIIQLKCPAPIPRFSTLPNELTIGFSSTSLNATSATYLWNFGDHSSDSSSISNAPSHVYAGIGTYTVCLSVDNSCITIPVKTCKSVTVCTVPTSTFTAVSSALTLTLTNTSTNAKNYSWNFGDTKTSTTASPVHKYTASKTYDVCLISSNTCGSKPDTLCDSVRIVCTPLTLQPICLVTVDPLSQHNIIVWQHPATTGIKDFVIYREIATNDYQPVGKVPYDSLSQFIDTTKSQYFPNTGNPNNGTYRYKIGILDTCGNYSQLSPYHNTIYITNTNGTFSWNSYTIENASNPVTSYVLLRRNDTASAWQQVASVAGTQTTVSDPNYASYPYGGWYVATEWAISCTPSRSSTRTTSSSNVIQLRAAPAPTITQTGDVLKSSALTGNQWYLNGIAISGATSQNFTPVSNGNYAVVSTNAGVPSPTSNIITISGLATGIEQYSFDNTLYVYPNPSDGNFYVKSQNVITTIEVTNTIGQTILIQQVNSTNTKVDISGQAKGVYFYKVNSNNNLLGTGKMIIE